MQDAPAFGLNWPERHRAEAQLHEPVPDQLRARPADSLDWDTTANLVVEGDNLPALKLLQNTFAHKVKLACIDPPYNTGRELVYPDSFRRSSQEWLTMMYPRLVLARELLTPDGVLCVSIDDTEVGNLRLLCDEIFGAENYVATFTWETKRAARGVPPRQLLMHNHEYVVCYAVDQRLVRFRGIDRTSSDFANPDDDPRGPWRSESMKATGNQDNHFTIVDPKSGNSFHANWAFSSTSLQRMIDDDLVIFPATPRGVPRQRKFLDSYTNATKAAVTALGWHSTERATKALMELFDGQKAFSFPKPLSLIEFFCRQLLNPGEFVIDFFAGSGTTGHAVMNVNAADAAHADRHFILVQRPEPLDLAVREQLTAAQVCDRLGKPLNIAELTKERLRRAAAKVRAEHPSYLGDVGFRVYDLSR